MPDPLSVGVVEPVGKPLVLQKLVSLHVQEQRLPSPGEIMFKNVWNIDIIDMYEQFVGFFLTWVPYPPPQRHPSRLNPRCKLSCHGSPAGIRSCMHGSCGDYLYEMGEMVYHNGSRVDGKERCSASSAVNTVPHLVEEWVVRTLRGSSREVWWREFNQNMLDLCARTTTTMMGENHVQ